MTEETAAAADLHSGQTRPVCDVLSAQLEAVLEETEAAALRGIAGTSSMLGMNALIAAAHAGDAGAGFQVVVQRIQDLARNSDTASVELGASIEDLSLRILAHLGDDDQRGGAGLSSQFEQHLNEVAAGQASLAAEVADVRRALEHAQGATGEVASLATGIAGHVQFQDITRQATGQVQRALERLADHSDMLIDYVEGRAKAEAVHAYGNATEQMVNEYVIQRQRTTHAEATSDAEAIGVSDGPAIELF